MKYTNSVTSVKLFQRGVFKLHKRHSNEQVLETNDSGNVKLCQRQLGTKPKKKKYWSYYGTKGKIIQIQNINKNATKQNLVHWPQSMSHVYY